MSMSDYYIQDNSDIENKKLEAAQGLYASGNYAGALKLYLDMVNTSYSYKLYYEIGRCYYKLNDIDNAELYFTHSISLDDCKNPSYTFLGNIFHKRGNIEKAIENWTLAFSYKPDDEAICLNLATSYFTKDMKFQSIFFYEKYLKYAKDKTNQYYLDIKKSIDSFKLYGNDFYQKAQIAISVEDKETAIQALETAVKNYPLGFDINYQLGKLYFEQQEYLKSSIYLKQAYCIDNKSLDVFELLANVMINLGDFTGAYCVMKRILPLITNNQKEYLEVIKATKLLEKDFNQHSIEGHKEWAEKYYSYNNYHFALFEYENCLIMNNNGLSDYNIMVQKLKSFINPEERIVKSCFEKGAYCYSNGDYRQANKYFSKIMRLSKENSHEYRLAKSRITHV